MVTSTQDLSHSMVHYLLTIHKLKEKRGFARVTDIAKDLNLTKGSVSTAINTLRKKDLVREEEDCKFLVLTDKGHQAVHKILSSRTLLFYFLKDFLKVDESVAIQDACYMEHLMSSQTRESFFNFMKNFSSQVKTDFDFTKYDSAESFMKDQIGDDYLKFLDE